VIERFNTLGAQAQFSTPEGLRAALTKQADTWDPIIREANIKLE
jgi:tripartite-type tricarboxylate transporter receptor subunit TctC